MRTYTPSSNLLNDYELDYRQSITEYFKIRTVMQRDRRVWVALHNRMNQMHNNLEANRPSHHRRLSIALGVDALHVEGHDAKTTCSHALLLARVVSRRVPLRSGFLSKRMPSCLSASPPCC